MKKILKGYKQVSKNIPFHFGEYSFVCRCRHYLRPIRLDQAVSHDAGQCEQTLGSRPIVWWTSLSVLRFTAFLPWLHLHNRDIVVVQLQYSQLPCRQTRYFSSLRSTLPQKPQVSPPRSMLSSVDCDFVFKAKLHIFWTLLSNNCTFWMLE